MWYIEDMTCSWPKLHHVTPYWPIRAPRSAPCVPVQPTLHPGAWPRSSDHQSAPRNCPACCRQSTSSGASYTAHAPRWRPLSGWWVTSGRRHPVVRSRPAQRRACKRGGWGLVVAGRQSWACLGGVGSEGGSLRLCKQQHAHMGSDFLYFFEKCLLLHCIKQKLSLNHLNHNFETSFPPYISQQYTYKLSKI